VLLLALFVRFGDPAARPHRALVASPADLRLVRWHHRVFYALLAAAPVEWWLGGRPAGWRTLAGAALLALGVRGYRRAGAALGPHLGPLVAPPEPAGLVREGPYGRVRHPMYRAEVAMAAGAASMLGGPVAAALAVAFAALIVYRISREERALAERLPDYPAYARRTARLVPHVY
jgi:protein-S-isoprenylcysteine O-methyltransferase Ste14